MAAELANQPTCGQLNYNVSGEPKGAECIDSLDKFLRLESAISRSSADAD